AYIILFLFASLLTEPPVKHSAKEEEKKFIVAIRHLINRRAILFFICAGFMYSATTSMGDLFNLGFVALDIKPEQLGVIFAAASLAGAALGLVVHHLKRLTFSQYVTVDVASMALTFIAFGFLQNKLLVIFLWAQNMALWRFQRIMYQHYLAQIYGNTRYKATLFSIIGNVATLHSIWLVLVITGVAHQIGVLHSLRYGLCFLLVFWLLLLFGIRKLSTKP
ncbi:MAG: hypothetical protein QG629_765, partial [Patescibacteria group bacterium]|nr:hypothetical protein [Patescibacteria group bacterium]